MTRRHATLPTLLLVSTAVLSSGIGARPGSQPGPAARGGTRPSDQLVLEDLAGERRTLALSELPVTDPRPLGGWLVRPDGFGQDSSQAAAESASGVAAADAESVSVLELAGGDRVRGRVSGGEGESLWLELVGGVTLPIDISSLASLRVPARLPGGLHQPLEPAEEGDRLYRRIGGGLDRIDGTVDGFDADGVRFESVLGLKTFPWSEVAALFVEVLGEEGDGPGAEGGDGVPIALDLVDASRLRGRLVALEGAGCRLRVAGGEPIVVEWRHVGELVVDDGHLSFLSELPAASEEGRGVPFGDDLGLVWSHQLDLAVDGSSLRSGGRVWRRGVGLHAPTRVTWTLDGRWDELRGLVAIDDAVLAHPRDARGSVVFRLHLDGELLWESGLVRGGDPPRALPRLELPAGGADATRELTVEVDPSGDFRGDRANLLRFLLVDR